MKKLDELDSYTRTIIKKEISTEINNYVTAIESGLNEKIQQKTSFQEIKS